MAVAISVLHIEGRKKARNAHRGVDDGCTNDGHARVRNGVTTA